MHTGRIIFSIITTLVVAGLLILGGVALYNAGWSQGYGTASLAASANSSATGGQAIQPGPGAAAPAVVVPYAYGYPFYRPWFFGPWTCLFPILALFAFFFLMRLLFFPFFGWRRHRHWMEGHPGWRGWPDEPGKPDEGKGGPSQGTPA
jgi:hypothetical protein